MHFFQTRVMKRTGMDFDVFCADNVCLPLEVSKREIRVFRTVPLLCRVWMKSTSVKTWRTDPGPSVLCLACSWGTELDTRSRNDHSTHPWLLWGQGLLLRKPLMCINEKLCKWRLELCRSGFIPGDCCSSRIGLAGYSKVVNTLHTFTLSKFSFLLSHTILLCRALRTPKSAA